VNCEHSVEAQDDGPALCLAVVHNFQVQAPNGPIYPVLCLQEVHLTHADSLCKEHACLLKLCLIAVVKAHDGLWPVVEFHEGLGPNLLDQVWICMQYAALLTILGTGSTGYRLYAKNPAGVKQWSRLVFKCKAAR